MKYLTASQKEALSENGFSVMKTRAVQDFPPGAPGDRTHDIVVRAGKGGVSIFKRAFKKEYWSGDPIVLPPNSPGEAVVKAVYEILEDDEDWKDYNNQRSEYVLSLPEDEYISENQYKRVLNMKFHLKNPENKSTIALQLGTAMLRAMKAGVTKEEVDNLWNELLVEEVQDSLSWDFANLLTKK